VASLSVIESCVRLNNEWCQGVLLRTILLLRLKPCHVYDSITWLAGFLLLSWAIRVSRNTEGVRMVGGFGRATMLSHFSVHRLFGACCKISGEMLDCGEMWRASIVVLLMHMQTQVLLQASECSQKGLIKTVRWSFVGNWVLA
jgi:hypothetical protein